MCTTLYVIWAICLKVCVSLHRDCILIRYSVVEQIRVIAERDLHDSVITLLFRNPCKNADMIHPQQSRLTMTNTCAGSWLATGWDGWNCEWSQTCEARLAVCKVPFDTCCEWDQWLAVLLWTTLQDVWHLLIISFCLQFKHTPIHWCYKSASPVDSHQPAPSAGVRQIHNFIKHIIWESVQR